MIQRKNEDRIRQFLLNEKRALLVTGARQTGKTFSIRKVGKECFENFIEINFLDDPAARNLFVQATDATDLLMRLSTYSKRNLVQGKTLIFFDEVQECKEIVTAIKFLVDDGSYRYVMSGSLLGVELQDIRSVPVGYMSVIDMYPLDLEEFARAVGIGEQVLDHIRQCYKDRKTVDSFVHQRMIDLVRLYLIVGGMPAAVQTYLDSNNLQKVYAVQRDIIRLYKMDIAKYNRQKKLQIEEIYNLIPAELNEKNKRFVLKNMNEKARFSKYEDSFLWLRDAGVAIPVYNVEEPRSPLALNRSRNLFKLFLNDVGLLTAMYASDNIQMRLLSGENTINYGAVFENFAAQELAAHGFAGDGRYLYYFNSKRQGELDFVLEMAGLVVPIEIKSGKDFHRHVALNNVLNTEQYDIHEALIFNQNNVEVNGQYVYLPIYMLMCLQSEPMQNDNIYKFDVTNLQSL